MKMKKLFLFAATAAVALSSCSKNEVTEVATPNDNLNTIGLSIGSFATKSTETTTTLLNTENNELSIYSYETSLIESGGTGTFDTQEFKSEGNDSWTNTAIETQTWKGVTFPLFLFSMNDGTVTEDYGNIELTPAVSDSESPAIVADDAIVYTALTEFSVEEDVAGQQDLVYYGAALAAIPTNGEITAVFKHALSRVKMTYEAEKGVNLYIGKVSLVNVSGTEKHVISVNDAGASSIAWSTPESQTDSYVYYTIEEVVKLEGTDAGLDSESYTAANDMYIIPQAVTGYEAEGNDALAYVEVVYIAEDETEIPLVGYTSGEKYPDTASLIWGDDDTYSNIVKVNEPLYVKVAFPLSYTFVDGVYYNLNLDFGGADIFVTEDGYFDKDGDAVTMPTDATVTPEEDDYVNVDAETEIGLTVTVSTWPTSSSSDLAGGEGSAE